MSKAADHQPSKKFVPYANEADVLTIGRLSIENRVDRITLSGDVDLTADQAGLADARALLELLGNVVAQLEARPDLPAQLPPPAVETVANPFA
ncbi:MAG: hypothetical protein ABW069_14120 [Duganella sp.]